MSEVMAHDDSCVAGCASGLKPHRATIRDRGLMCAVRDSSHAALSLPPHTRIYGQICTA